MSEHICPHCSKPYTYFGTEAVNCSCEGAIRERETMCGLADRTIAQCNPPIEPHSNPARCGICGRKV